jgi:Leucine-rich repeat (LRR) protein
VPTSKSKTRPDRVEIFITSIKRFFQISTFFVLVMGSAFSLAACSSSIDILGTEVDRSAAELDLRNLEITDAQSLIGLQKLRKLTALDLRDNHISIETFEFFQSELPKCRIRWSVPLGTARYDSESKAILTKDFSQNDLGSIAYFPLLETFDATGSTNYTALVSAQTNYPAVAFYWDVMVAGSTFSNTDQDIVCAAGTTSADVDLLLSALPMLESIDLRHTNLVTDDVATYQSAYPDVKLLTNGFLLNERFDTAVTHAKLAASETFEAEVLREQLAQFPNLTELDLRDLPAEERDVVTLGERYPALQIRWNVPILDSLRVDSDTEALDLRGHTVDDLVAFKQKLRWLKNLNYLDMCNCGPSDVEMAMLRSELPQVKVVWMLRVGYWEIRTDIKAFSMAQEGEHEGVRFTKIGDEIRRYRWVTNEEISKMRYCTDVEALDIGHSHLITDISFVRQLPKLRFFVMSLAKVPDISPIRTLKNLVFLELFGCDLTDVSVLYDLPQLEYLNCSANLITDINPLLSLKNLKRLWIIKCHFTNEQLRELKVGLPDTLVIAKGAHPTATGWRYDNPRYLEMQALFGLAPQLDWMKPEYLLPINQIP